MLFKVFKTDSVDKYMGCDERKSAYSATENSKNTEKVRVASCVVGVCVLCLFLGTVGCSGLFVVISGHTHFLNTILYKTLPRLHGLAGCSVPSLLAYN